MDAYSVDFEAARRVTLRRYESELTLVVGEVEALRAVCLEACDHLRALHLGPGKGMAYLEDPHLCADCGMIQRLYDASEGDI
jgi:hypothetical protein